MQKKNVLISDANHGGLILLEEYHKYTNNNLFFYDVYNKLSAHEKEILSGKFDVRFLSLDEIKSREDEFVKINPVHMPPVIATDYTHHEFVGYLLNKAGYDFRIIQVTGVKGKTTVATLIGSILEDFNTLLLTSNSLTYNNDTLIEHLSIAPASIITAINTTRDKGIIDEIDFCVFEVSLGAVPKCFMSILTNVIEDYPIANNSGSASVAKGSVFSSDITLCDLDSYVNYYGGHDAITISFDDGDADIFSSDVSYDINNSSFVVNYFDRKVEVSTFALSDFYINNLLFAFAAGLMIGMDEDVIVSKLSKSNEIKGRNSYKMMGDRIIIEDINPGLNTTAIGKCIGNLDKFKEKPLLVIGGDYGITCEEIDEEKLVKYLDNLDITIVFAGELGSSLSKKVKKRHKQFNLLKDAVGYSLNENNTKLIQILYRSEYNGHDADLYYLD